MTRRIWLGLATLGIALVLVTAAAAGHWAQRRVEFISLTNGERGIHPARSFDIALRRPVPPGTSSLLTGSAGPVATIDTPLIDDPNRMEVKPVQPLQWLSTYRLCILQQHGHLLQRLIGPSQSCISFHTEGKPAPTGRPDAAILVLLGRDRLYGAFYGSILEGEGFNNYATSPASDLTTESLQHRKVVVLAASHLNKPALAALTHWVRQGGLLIAMRPGPALYPLLGLKSFSVGALRWVSLVADRSTPYTRGIAATPLRLHGSLDLFRVASRNASAVPATAKPLDDAQQAAPLVLARLTEGAYGTPLPYPAVTLAQDGTGHAVAFAFDLATSVVLSRQGNPQWADEERDGFSPRRPNDLFYPDFVDLNNANVPQADELQRLFANITVLAAAQPAPRFWYLPGERRAAVIMAGDDHDTQGGTRGLFDRLSRESPAGCSFDNWTCLRATAYLTPPTKLAPALAEQYAKLGFEIGVHVDSGCRDRATPQLAKIIDDQMAGFRRRYPNLPPQQTLRVHCIVWNGWVDVPRIERRNGIRLEMNYYYWPPKWIKRRPGFMTGSGLPMPYVDENGRVLDIYQAATQLVNEDGVPQEYAVSVMLDRALGADQFFAALGTHFDYTDQFASRIIAAAEARGVALVTAHQMLTWLDGRNNSLFDDVRWNDDRLSFRIELHHGAAGASVMLPESFAQKQLVSVMCSGLERPLTWQVIKGIDYGFYQAVPGDCEARYRSVGNGGMLLSKGN